MYIKLVNAGAGGRTCCEGTIKGLAMIVKTSGLHSPIRANGAPYSGITHAHFFMCACAVNFVAK